MAAASGTSLTLRVLRGSPNPAATRVLLEALRCQDTTMRTGAVRALAARGDDSAHEELLAATGDMTADARAAAAEPGVAKRLRRTVIAALESGDVLRTKRACRYAIDAELFAALPTLVEQASRPEHEYGVGLATAAVQLCRAMANGIEQRTPRTSADGDDPAFYRTTTLQRLTEAADRFGEHRRLELVEALLLITTRDNTQLLRMLRTENHACHAAIVETLETSPSCGALDLLCHALVDSDSPKRLVAIAAERSDKAFLARLGERLGYPIGARARENAKKVLRFSWMDSEHHDGVLALGGELQASLVALAAATSAAAAERLRFVKAILNAGDERGRVAACHLLRDFESPDVASLLRSALEDDAPAVVAAAARQLRPRRLAGAEAVLIGLLDHPAELVRRAAQDELHELSLASYRDLFERLAEPARRAAGRLVARADPEAADQLAADLQRPVVRQRMEGLAMIDAMGLVDDLAEPLAGALSDTDAGVRAEAARLLGSTTTRHPGAYTALADAVTDSSPLVRSAVEKSLDAMRSLEQAADLVGQLQDEFPSNDPAGGGTKE